jgi:hypothetical protein
MTAYLSFGAERTLSFGAGTLLSFGAGQGKGEGAVGRVIGNQ